MTSYIFSLLHTWEWYNNTVQKRKQISLLQWNYALHTEELSINIEEEKLNRQIMNIKKKSPKTTKSLKWLGPPTDFRSIYYLKLYLFCKYIHDNLMLICLFSESIWHLLSDFHWAFYRLCVGINSEVYFFYISYFFPS